MSKVLEFEDLLGAFASEGEESEEEGEVQDSGLAASLHNMELEFQCALECWQLEELRRRCKGVARVHVAYYTSDSNFPAQIEWRRGIEQASRF